MNAAKLQQRQALDVIKSRLVNVAASLYSTQIAKWTNDYKNTTNFKEANQVKEVSPLSKGIIDTLNINARLAYFMGLSFLKDEIEAQDKAQFAVVQKIDWNTVGFAEAERILSEKITIPGPIFKNSMAEVKSVLFSVQRIEQINAIRVVKESLLAAIRSGITFRDWQDGLTSFFKMRGYSKGPGLQPWHEEVIFRTNQSSVYNASRWEGMQSDDNVEAMEYLAILDTRVRDAHADLSGFIAAKDAQIWEEIYPPNDYQCRCDVTPVTMARIRRDGIRLLTGKDVNRKSLAGIHEDFTGKNTILGLDEKLKSRILEATTRIDELTFNIDELLVA